MPSNYKPILALKSSRARVKRSATSTHHTRSLHRTTLLFLVDRTTRATSRRVHRQPSLASALSPPSLLPLSPDLARSHGRTTFGAHTRTRNERGRVWVEWGTSTWPPQIPHDVRLLHRSKVLGSQFPHKAVNSGRISNQKRFE